MTSRAARLRNKKAAQAHNLASAVVAHEAVQAAPQQDHTGRGGAIRPTPERAERGTWAKPTGTAKSRQPFVDMASDMVGWLFVNRLITSSQEQAARHWQQLREDYRAEFPETSDLKSCLSGSVPGFDDGDGDPLVIAAYRRLENAMTLPQRREMLHVCADGHNPTSLGTLRGALDAIGVA